MFEKLPKEVIPEALRLPAGTTGTNRFNSGVSVAPGGEEPYSLAIMLREFFSREIRHARLSLLGTDIDDTALQAAQTAEYDEGRFKEMPVGLRERYFRRSGKIVLA